VKSAVDKIKNAGVSGLLLVLVGVCVLSMAGVAAYYHMALGRVAREAAQSSEAAQNGLRSSHALVESLTLTQNALQTLLRERDPDIVEKLVDDLDAKQHGLSERIKLIGVSGRDVQTQFEAWSKARQQIVETFLRGDNAQANSELVNRLMPQSERVLAGVRQVNEANEKEAAERSTNTGRYIIKTRDRAIMVIAVVALIIAAGGAALRQQVARGTGAVAEALGRLTTLRAANEALEERVKERTAQIARSNAQMAAIYQTSLECIFVLDDQGRIIEFNPAAEHAFECGTHDAVGKRFGEFVTSGPRGALNGNGNGNGDRGALLGRRIEVTARRPDGTTFPAEMALTAAKIEGPPLYIASLRDISERRHAEAERDDLNNRLLIASRQAGMNEVATGVLHNVGNVLNSVNVAATVITNKLKQSEVASLAKVGEMIQEHTRDLASFLTNDERGKMVPEFICDLAKCIGEEQEAMLAELATLAKGVEHIKQTVCAQQSLARRGSVLSLAQPSELIEMAMTMQGGALVRHEIEVVREIEDVPAFPVDKHKVVQILINLISNAKHAVKAGASSPRRITLGVESVDTADGPHVRFVIRDNGVGIPPENMTKIFTHGFTTKKDGHGFGLHSAANAAREMGGSLTAASDGPGRGATFALEIPMEPEQSHDDDSGVNGKGRQLEELCTR
jgi:PAS domain S-box-containing protein